MNVIRLPKFTRYVGIDYSGAETPTASLKGLRVYLAGEDIGNCRSAATAQPTQILDASGYRPLAR